MATPVIDRVCGTLFFVRRRTLFGIALMTHRPLIPIPRVSRLDSVTAATEAGRGVVPIARTTTTTAVVTCATAANRDPTLVAAGVAGVAAAAVAAAITAAAAATVRLAAAAVAAAATTTVEPSVWYVITAEQCVCVF